MPFKQISEKDMAYWDTCPNCNTKPELWLFDNGEYARCDCMEKYKDNTYISGPNIGECYNKGKLIKQYNPYELCDNWNKHIKHLIRKNKIETFLKTLN